MEGEVLKKELIAYGQRLGFSGIRITSAEPLEIWKQEIEKRKRIDPETNRYWKRITTDPRDILPSAKSIIVAVRAYIPYPENFPNKIGRYSAHYREYPIGREKAGRLGDFLKQRGYDVVDDPPLPAKAIAHRAGVGYFGKNGVIHINGYGSWITLHCILTNAPLPPDESMDRLSDCGSCVACVRACPTGAIQEGGMVLPDRCIRNYMLSSDFIPVDIRDKIGTRLLGCDSCQAVCPKNGEALKNANLPPENEMEVFDITKILCEWRLGLSERMKQMGELIGNNYARAQKVLSMAVIIAGNTKDPFYIPMLAETLKHPHPPIRGHSAWALGKIGGIKSLQILQRALEDEMHPQVIEEIKQALDKKAD